MEQSKFINFSNTLSPRSLALCSKKNDLFNTQRISPNAFRKRPSPSLSPPSISPRARKEFISNLQNISHYRKQNKITFTGQRVMQINERLEIDQQIQKNFEKRQKTNTLMIKDGNNPFTNFLLSSPDREQAAKKPDIITQVKKIKEELTTAIVDKKLGKRTTGVEVYMQHVARKKSLINKHADKSIEIKHFEQEQPQPYVVYKDELQIFEELTKIKEESFFSKKRKEAGWNIFSIINDKDHRDFHSNREILQRYYFSQDSMYNAQINQGKAYPENCLQEISVFPRSVAMVHPKKHPSMPERFMIVPGDMRLNAEKLKFYDLMAISNGRLTSFVLLKYFREEDIASKAELDEDEEQRLNEQKEQPKRIIYNGNSTNCGVDFNQGILDRGDIGVYQNTQMSEIQLKQECLSQTYKDKYRKLVIEEALSLSNTIKDKKLLQSMHKQKTNVLLKQLDSNADPRINRLMKEVDRKIRQNKMEKNRTEKIKVNLVIDTLRIGRDTSRSKDKHLNTYR